MTSWRVLHSVEHFNTSLVEPHFKTLIFCILISYYYSEWMERRINYYTYTLTHSCTYSCLDSGRKNIVEILSNSIWGFPFEAHQMEVKLMFVSSLPCFPMSKVRMPVILRSNSPGCRKLKKYFTSY